MALTAKQERFVEEYLVDLNATQAAIRAGYSEKTAYSVGHENLSKPDISDAIAKAQAIRAERTGITQDRVLQELGRIGFADIRNVVRWGKSPIDTEADHADPNGLRMYPVELVPVEGIDDDTALAISEVSLTQTGVKVKMHDKLSALEKIGKHLGMFTDRVDHTSSDGSMTPAPAVNLSGLSDEELAQLERLTDKAANPDGVGEA
ncbi:hypothetical protein LCGC14_2682080 [marine sediment metagenome]|uniref:Terminase small subunit n=1 Tax=marine sediment metagenome TaxID=412755 RepID=A0A0F8ZL40_9ZZZZ